MVWSRSYDVVFLTVRFKYHTNGKRASGPGKRANERKASGLGAGHALLYFAIGRGSSAIRSEFLVLAQARSSLMQGLVHERVSKGKWRIGQTSDRASERSIDRSSERSCDRVIEIVYFVEGDHVFVRYTNWLYPKHQPSHLCLIAWYGHVFTCRYTFLMEGAKNKTSRTQSRP